MRDLYRAGDESDETLYVKVQGGFMTAAEYIADRRTARLYTWTEVWVPRYVITASDPEIARFVNTGQMVLTSA